MTSINSYSELFQKGKEFNQVYFLDNFYDLVDLNSVSESELFTFIEYGIANTSNSYVHRGLLDVLTNLSIYGYIQNNYQVLAIILNELNRNIEDLTLSLILKRLIHFDLVLKDAKIVENIKALCDHDSADVSSQAYLCLGILGLLVDEDLPSDRFLLKLEESKKMFQASYEAIATISNIWGLHICPS